MKRLDRAGLHQMNMALACVLGPWTEDSLSDRIEFYKNGGSIGVA